VTVPCGLEERVSWEGGKESKVGQGCRIEGLRATVG